MERYDVIIIGMTLLELPPVSVLHSMAILLVETEDEIKNANYSLDKEICETAVDDYKDMKTYGILNLIKKL